MSTPKLAICKLFSIVCFSLPLSLSLSLFDHMMFLSTVDIDALYRQQIHPPCTLDSYRGSVSIIYIYICKPLESQRRVKQIQIQEGARGREREGNEI